MSLDLTDDKSSLVQVMALANKPLPELRSTHIMSPYGVIRTHNFYLRTFNFDTQQDTTRVSQVLMTPQITGILIIRPTALSG